VALGSYLIGVDQGITPARPVEVLAPMQVGLAPVLLDVVTTRAGFEALETEWNALFTRAGRGEHMFLTHAWLHHWANHYLTLEEPVAVVTARRHGRLILAWPMLVTRTAGLRCLTAWGDPVSQYVDVLAEPVRDLPALLDAAFHKVVDHARPDLVRLPKVRADATLTPSLKLWGFRITATEEAPYATLAGCADYATFETRFSQKLRKNRRRQLRRLEERGPLDEAVHTGTPAAAEAVATTMRLKRLWLQKHGLVSRAFADRRFDTFFADAAASTQRPAGVEVSVLMSNGDAVDLNIAISAKGRRGLHILAYDERVEKLGAGNHHLELCLQRAFADGVEVFDFLAPRHPYKMEWADGVMPVHDHAKALTWRGRFYLDVYVARLREWVKLASRKLPKRLMQPLSRWHLEAGKA
jgi:CelD/BcsL family acetyltransferase involved in cellulose biosynthesis